MHNTSPEVRSEAENREERMRNIESLLGRVGLGMSEIKVLLERLPREAAERFYDRVAALQDKLVSLLRFRVPKRALLTLLMGLVAADGVGQNMYADADGGGGGGSNGARVEAVDAGAPSYRRPGQPMQYGQDMWTEPSSQDSVAPGNSLSGGAADPNDPTYYQENPNQRTSGFESSEPESFMGLADYLDPDKFPGASVLQAIDGLEEVKEIGLMEGDTHDQVVRRYGPRVTWPINQKGAVYQISINGTPFVLGVVFTGSNDYERGRQEREFQQKVLQAGGYVNFVAK